jgi:hypothetical protein
MDHEDCRAADEANGLKALLVGVGGLTGGRQGVVKQLNRGRKVDLVIPEISLILLRAPCALDHRRVFCSYNNVATNTWMVESILAF